METTESADSTVRNTLLREYEMTAAQLLAFDDHLWRKSQFFVLIESALLAVASGALLDSVAMEDSVDEQTAVIGVILGSLNALVCYIWFRVTRSNMEYMMVRHERLMEIESDSRFMESPRLYRRQREMLAEPRFAKNSSRLWTKHLPSIFLIAWVALLAYTGLQETESIIGRLPLVSSVAVVIAVGFVEISGVPSSPHRKPSSATPKQGS